MTTIVDSTRQYEAWAKGQIPVVRDDLKAKYERMADDAFSFLRATFYRWMQLLPELCSEAFSAPVVLSVGDLHVENYGTWRDAEGRLVWGINDFDEAFPLPYTNDLIRLATSAWLAIELESLTVLPVTACECILDGYTTGLQEGEGPFVLSERHRWLRDIVTSKLRDPTEYWQKLAALPLTKSVPAEPLTLLRNAMPHKKLPFQVAHRRAGLGSLGRERYTALADWCGGKISREAKRLMPSACTFAGYRADDAHIYYADIVQQSARSADPFLALQGSWVLRRLSPYCSRVELASLARSRDEERLLWGMGRELANIHFGVRTAVPKILRDLQGRKAKWLRQAAGTMTEAMLRDWKVWRKR